MRIAYLGHVIVRDEVGGHQRWVSHQLVFPWELRVIRHRHVAADVLSAHTINKRTLSTYSQESLQATGGACTYVDVIADDLVELAAGDRHSDRV